MTITLKFYDCMLRLGGDPILMQIKKTNISERELRVLRHVHGAEAITDIKPTEAPGKEHERQVDENEHYFELAEKFDNNVPLIERIFNKTLDGFEEWIFEKQYQEEQKRSERERLRAESSSGQVPSATTGSSGGGTVEAIE